MTVTGTGPWTLSTTSAINVSNTTTWPSGYYTFSVRAKNAIGKWGTPATVVVVIGNPPPVFRGLFFSTTGNSTVPTVAGVADDADIYGWNGSVFSRDWNANLFGVVDGANVDAYDRVDATHFYLSFADNTTLGGTLTVQDEDVVYYNNGVWSVFFDGTGAGLTNGNQDVDAIAILGGTVYLSTLGNTNPPAPAAPPTTPTSTGGTAVAASPGSGTPPRTACRRRPTSTACRWT